MRSKGITSTTARISSTTCGPYCALGHALLWNDADHFDDSPPDTDSASKRSENLSFSRSLATLLQKKKEVLFHHYLHCRTSQSTHTCPTTTEITQPETPPHPLQTPPIQKTTQPLSQHASSFFLGHMNMSTFALRLQSVFVGCVPCSFQKLNRLLSLTFDFSNSETAGFLQLNHSNNLPVPTQYV